MSKLDVLAGIIGSDGHLDKSKPQIKIISGDIEFLEKSVIPLVKEIVSKETKPKSSISGFGHERFIIDVCSAWHWRLLQEEHKIPKGKKSDIDIIPEIKEIKDKLDFIAGWFAGDGSVTTDRSRVRLMIWSKARGVLGWIQQVLKEAEIDSALWFGKTREKWVLSIGKQDSIKRFHQLIEIPHPKKQRKLESLLSN